MVVSKAAKAIGLLGAGLRTGFSSQAKVLLPVLLEKLKEKKLAVAAALNEALDILGEQCFTLLDVMEDILLFPCSHNFTFDINHMSLLLAVIKSHKSEREPLIGLLVRCSSPNKFPMYLSA